MLFWMMLPRFMAGRQGLLPDHMPYQDFMNFWYKKIGAPLMKSMVAGRCIELFGGVLADDYRVYSFKYPSNFTSMCQELLYESTTRFQHARLRQISLIRSNVSDFFSEWDQSVPHTAETNAISTICRHPGSGLRALATLSDKMLIDDNVERIGKMRAEWDDLGHYCYAMAADWFQVATLLDKDEPTVKSTSAEIVPTLGELGGEDYWTWDWEVLGSNPEAVGNGETVGFLRGKQREWEGEQMGVRVRWVGFLEKCLEAAGEGLGLGGKVGFGLFDEGRYPWG